MITSLFELVEPTIVVAGGGAISTAIIRNLHQRYPGGKIYQLARRRPEALPDGVAYLPFEATDSGSATAAADAVSEQVERVHLLFNGIGVLHGEDFQPEKRVRDLAPDAFGKVMAINAYTLPLLANAFNRLLRHAEPAMLASLSARVGSIADNDMGGWYSYRASKAAHNMLLRCLSREWRVSHRNVTLLALHPGTVDSGLSKPFVTSAYRNRVFTPDESAGYLLEVMRAKTAEDSGHFYDWQGEVIDW